MRDARAIAVEALIQVNSHGGYSGLVLDGLLSENRLSAQDSALCSALFYGVLDRLITIDFLISKYCSKPIKNMLPIVRESLRIGIYQIVFMDRIPTFAAVNSSVEIVKSTKKGRYAAGFVNAVLRKIAANGARDIETAGDEVKFSCPEWIINSFIADYGKDDAYNMLKEFMRPSKTYIRINNIKCSEEQLINALAAEKAECVKSSAVSGAFELKFRGGITNLKAYRDGLFHVQDLSSQLCCAALCLDDSTSLLDLCAAPGGKTFTSAEIMNGRGRVLSCELHDHRVKLIKSGASRLGLGNVSVIKNDAKIYNSNLGMFDRVLCDVPCSGLGDIGRKPDIKYKKEDISRLPSVQSDILETACKYVKPGGLLFYSTCTLRKAENDDVVNEFLGKHRDFSPFEIPIFSNKHKITLMPHKNGTDGFFIAAMKKR